jgi:ATP-dependent RNA helicase DDX6/DHH1
LKKLIQQSIIFKVRTLSLFPPSSSHRLSIVLLLVPTRELALQTSAIVKEIGKHMPIQVMVTTGGTNLREDIMRLYSPVHVLVGTPGRIHDLADKGIADLSHCNTFVMDEV